MQCARIESFVLATPPPVRVRHLTGASDGARFTWPAPDRGVALRCAGVRSDPGRMPEPAAGECGILCWRCGVGA
jgi:hypothetical protein